MTLQGLAEARFDEFCKQMKNEIGAEFDKRDLDIFRNVFVNGYHAGVLDCNRFIKDTN